MAKISPGMLVTVDDDNETIYRVNDVSLKEQSASLRLLFPESGKSDPNSTKWERCKPIRKVFLEGKVREHVNKAKTFMDAMLYAP